VKIWLSWSSGKDSAWALHELRQSGEHEVVGLLTTVNVTHDRVAMHAVRRELLEAQARAVGLPLHVVELPYPCPNGAYEQRMAGACMRAIVEGVEGIAFGDLFLEDIRQYRVDKLAQTGLAPIFPLWQRPTAALARQMVDGGLRAHLTSVWPEKLDASFVGRDFDHALLDELPAGVDPCGENGEFHSFVWDGPMFSAPVPVRLGERIERDGFAFADLLPNADT
jgi:uncharacterized protein (TIGR00290 family)